MAVLWVPNNGKKQKKKFDFNARGMKMVRISVRLTKTILFYKRRTRMMLISDTGIYYPWAGFLIFLERDFQYYLTHGLDFFFLQSESLSTNFSTKGS